MGGGAFSGELYWNEQEEEVELEGLAFVPARWPSFTGTGGRQSMGTEAGSWVDGTGTCVCTLRRASVFSGEQGARSSAQCGGGGASGSLREDEKV